jgi:hypothetical protein
MKNQNKTVNVVILYNVYHVCCRSLHTSRIRPKLEMDFERLESFVEVRRVQDPHQGLVISILDFKEPYPGVEEVDLLSIGTMDLLNTYVYPSLSGYGKFTISLKMLKEYGEIIPFTLGKAIPLTNADGTLHLPKKEIYLRVLEIFKKNAAEYKGSFLLQLMVRAYLDRNEVKDRPSFSVSDRFQELLFILDSLELEIESEIESEIEEKPAREMKHSNRKYSEYITSLKRSSRKRAAFMVSDLETVIVDNNHRAYAGGVMLVYPGSDVRNSYISTYFSEDYYSYMKDFKDRSDKVLFDLIHKIIALVKKEKTVNTVYFHNFSRFDGIILLKYLVCKHPEFDVKTVFRNNRLYEVTVYDLKSRKLLFKLRDSLNLLPGTLDNLAKSLCPTLGSKGSIDYASVRVDNLMSNKEELIEYMKQDILLLGGIMLKAQEIYYNLFQLDIVSKLTLSSLVLSIFRFKFYDEQNWPIYIPTMNQDNFIRKGYYGGHTDMFKPKGEDLYYYDVNSLYPFVMKEFDMPGGKPVWHGNLEGMELDSMCGFIEAYVDCPLTIKKPFLPFRKKDETLIFPTGEFIGVYYTEELKFARDLGYKVLPLKGYLYEKKKSPFKDLVHTLSSNRVKAKKDGNDALSYVYKILMNSLYGRFGIHPKSTGTDICDLNRYKTLVKSDSFISGDMLAENTYLVIYHVNAGLNEDEWNPPLNSAVQMSAAITACSRIYMYQFISRDDCYYTDTDSVVLGHPLPDKWIDSSVLGKLKLEDRILEGFFIAPKSYCYKSKDVDGKEVIKHKGATKSYATWEWFKAQYADPSRKELVPVTSNFRINWHTLEIQKREGLYKLGINQNSKRYNVFINDEWVDTDPIHIRELSNVTPNSGEKIIHYLKNELNHHRSKSGILSEKLEERDREIGDLKIKIESLEKTNPSSANPTVNKIPKKDYVQTNEERVDEEKPQSYKKAKTEKKPSKPKKVPKKKKKPP